MQRSEKPGSASDASLPGASRRVYLLLLALIAAAYSLWVLSLPVFPTQDGPMHLYYTHILHALLFGTPGIYSRFYTVRHILPPYALYYYTLMFFGKFVSLVTADKIVTCLYFFSFAFGFRFLASAVGPRGDLMALLATPLLLSWSLGMGFLNFCLSASLALWALGFWSRSAGRHDPLRKIAFVLLAYAIMLTHPIPLLAVIVFCFVELAIRFFRYRGSRAHGQPTLPPHMRSDLLTLAAAMGTLVYIKLFTTRLVTQHRPGDSNVSYLHSILDNSKLYLLQRTVGYFAGHSLAVLLYRAGCTLLLLIPALIALRELKRRRPQHLWTLADTWLVVAATLALLLPFIPNEVNNAHFFGARLAFFIWLAALAAASGASWRHPRLDIALVLTIVAFNVLILVVAEQRVRPIAHQIEQLEQFPITETHQVGLLLESPAYENSNLVSFDPFNWAGVHIFRRSDSVLFNSPWLEFPVMPLAGTPAMPTGKLSASLLEQPDKLSRSLLTSEESRSRLFPNIDFALVSTGSAPSAVALDPALRHFPTRTERAAERQQRSIDPALLLDPDPTHHWICTEPHAWFSLCHTAPLPILP